MGNIGKTLNKQISHGESIGIIKYSDEGLIIFKQLLEELLIKDEEYLNTFYLSAVQKLIDRNIKVNTMIVKDNEWQEFDFPEDIEIFRNDIINKKLNIK